MLDATQLLALVDAAEPLDPIRRSLVLWRAVAGDRPLESLWRAPVGCRDRALLDLRTAEVGPTLELADGCAECGEQVEFVVDTAALQLPTPALDNPPFAVEVGARSLRVRHVSCDDLAAAASDPGADLLLRCLVDEPQGSALGALAPLSAEERAAVDAALASGDPQADITFELECPACRHRWSALLDIGEVLWTELQQRARRLLLEVDVLARAYHWSERDILQLPAARRRRYLDLVAT
jgi:hypothetical protein